MPTLILWIVIAITASDVDATYTAPVIFLEEEVDARVENKTAWQDIATAPRDGQWFWATSGKAIYRVYWCAKRQCFVHTKQNCHVYPAYWKWDYP